MRREKQSPQRAESRSRSSPIKVTPKPAGRAGHAHVESTLTRPAWPLSPVQIGESHTRSAPSPTVPTLGRCHSEGQESEYESLWLLWPPPRAWASHPDQQGWTKQELHQKRGDREHISGFQRFPTPSPGGQSSPSPYLSIHGH